MIPTDVSLVIAGIGKPRASGDDPRAVGSPGPCIT